MVINKYTAMDDAIYRPRYRRTRICNWFILYMDNYRLCKKGDRAMRYNYCCANCIKGKPAERIKIHLRMLPSACLQDIEKKLAEHYPGARLMYLTTSSKDQYKIYLNEKENR